MAAGKKPFYLKKSAQKELEMDRRFSDLSKGRGGKKRVEKLIEKKRKKDAFKDRRTLPGERIDHHHSRGGGGVAHGEAGGRINADFGRGGDGGVFKRRRHS